MEIKAFIVDDEERQRRSIVKHVEWERYQMRVTGEWEDAEQALAAAAVSPPDLLITDIRLIGTDGLELSSRMKQINPNLSIIMVTGYEEFQYAKTAVDIGVDAFLVKPIIFDELHATLERISREKEKQLLLSREAMKMKAQLDAFKPIAQQQWLQEVLHGLVVGEETIRAQAKAMGLFTAEGQRRVLTVLVSAESTSPISNEVHVRRQVRARLEESVEEACGPLLEARTTSGRGDIVLIVRSQDGADFEAETEWCLARLSVEIGRMETGTARIGVGPPALQLSMLSESFRLAQRAVNQSLLGGDEHAYSWRLLAGSEGSQEKSVEELTADFFEVAGAGDVPNSLSLLGELLGRVGDPFRMGGSELRSLCMLLISRTYRAASEVGDASRSFGPEQKLWGQVFDCWEEAKLLQETVQILKGLLDFIAERKKSHTRVVVQQALEYMKAHYADNLSLKSVAESVFLSPNYLGALFRVELGISFTDQLILIRVQKAKEMLQHPQFKLYEVAENVGYKNIGYFTNVFKRITGVTPKEYRDCHG